MGEVYRADDLTLAQPVALKFLPSQVGSDPSRLARFHAEVRTARQVSHPNVCRIYDTSQVNGQHFLSMEYVDGEDLASLLRRIGRFPTDKAIEIARQLCAGLAAAHDKGVLHRDLKPANIMIDGRGKVRIADFGLARIAGDLRDANVIEGTPAYMAPEQFTGKGESIKSDIYSLGLVLYEMFTGKPAFKADSVMELSRLQREATPASPSVLLTEIDPVVERVILRCLEKDPGLRPASALAVAAALPGGDPLAAALAAGETPSPEMVAAAGDEGGLAAPIALTCLASILLGLLGSILLTSRTHMFHYAPLGKSPDALSDRAREVIKKLGYPEDPLDSARGFLQTDYIRYLRENDKSASRWDKLKLGQPPGIAFWYRQSPRYLLTTEFFRSGTVGLNQPPQLISGMTSVLLDPKGRLIKFDAVPPQVENLIQESPKPDWSALFGEAGLSITEFSAVTSTWVPPVYAESRAAWEGLYPDRPDIKIRIEAAASRGKPVYFQIFEPWSRPSRMEERQQTMGEKVANIIGALVLLGLVFGALFLARRNLQAGRGDKKGAFRLSLYLFLLQLAAAGMEADYAPTINYILPTIALILGRALILSGAVWLGYIALEPHVRRIWPHTMIAWSRILAGGFRDPLVGRDILIGGVAGVGMALLPPLLDILVIRLGTPPGIPTTGSMTVLLGFRHYAGQLCQVLSASVLQAMLLFLWLFLLRIIVRRLWIAVAIALLINAVQNALIASANPVLMVVFALVLSGVFIFVLMRFGLLATIATWFFSTLLVVFPMTTDLSAWYAGACLFALIVAVSLAIYGFRTALAGRPVFRTELLND
jgi:serine/threonine-protein kinase